MTVLTISTGTPEREAYVAAWRLKSCGLKWTPTSVPAFLTITLACGIGDWENPLIALYSFPFDVVLQPVCQLFGDEDRF